MQIALAVFCVAAIAFLVWVLAALVREGRTKPADVVEVYCAKYVPPRQEQTTATAGIGWWWG